MVAAPAPPAASGTSSGSAAPSTEDPGLRERKKRATRRALRLAGLELVAERGLDAVTTEEIAAAAGVSPRTFFNYFTGKEDALVGNDPELLPRLLAGLAARPADEPVLDWLRAAFLSYARDVVIDRDLWRLRMRVVEQNPPLRAAMVGATAELERRLAVLVAERLGLDPAEHPYPRLAANLAVAAARAALLHVGSGRPGRELADVLAESFDAIAAGLPAPR